MGLENCGAGRSWSVSDVRGLVLLGLLGLFATAPACTAAPAARAPRPIAHVPSTLRGLALP